MKRFTASILLIAAFTMGGATAATAAPLTAGQGDLQASRILIGNWPH